MGFWDFLRGPSAVTSTRDVAPFESADVTYAAFSPRVEYLGGAEWSEAVTEAVTEDWRRIRGMSAAALWNTQPHLRTVVSFLARNVAQLGLHSFERISDTDRVRDRKSPLATALANPGDGLTSYDLIFALVGDKALYDRAYLAPWVDDSGAWRLRRIPPSWVSVKKRHAFGVETYTISLAGGGKTDVPASSLIVFGGYSPTRPSGCSPTVDALKETLGEQVEASRYRMQVWKRGGRASAVLSRPAGAPQWSDKAAERFREDWYAKYTGNGALAGGTPILEDGMTLNKVDFSATDQQWVEGAKLAFATVAAGFHVNPTMVGILDNANYSNVREFRRMLYGDTLGPTLAEFEAVLNTFALPLMGMDPTKFYVEFNIAEKLQGSFEEQAAVMSTMVGRPIMTADEGRARFNLPGMGGDASRLVTPLNVLIGGQSSPRDSGSQNRNPKARQVEVKERAPETYEAKAEQVVSAFFKRQERVIRGALGRKSEDDWWDGERWDDELSSDLFALALNVSTSVAAKTLQDIGFQPDEYDPDRTIAWLEEASRRNAININQATVEALRAAIDGDDPEALTAAFAGQLARASQIATTITTMISAFATQEAAKQVAGDAAMKTWISGPNARPSHAAMDGETVPLPEDFSNGLPWPGAFGEADEVAGCNCSLAMTIP